MLDFLILGPLEVRDNGVARPIGGSKQRAVLAILLLDAGRVVSSDRLIDLLWGEQPPPSAAASLQNFISQLRKALGTDAVSTAPPGYRLEVAPQQLDVVRFQQAVETARAKPPDERAAELREALALWRGPALADLIFEPFAEHESARLEELRLSVLEDRIDADLAAGRDAELVGELEALVREHPLRERLHGHLMLALYRSGRQAEALDVYHGMRRRLVEELGIEPSGTLHQLHSAILRQDSRLERNGREPATAGDDSLRDVVETMLSGRLVPVLGTDVADLTTRLSERFAYPLDAPELPRVAQYVAVMRGPGPLHDELHALLEADVPPTTTHRFFASLPPLLRARGAPHQLIVTTSYDLALEQAFLDAGEEFDVVSYIAEGRSRGKFCHIDPQGNGTLIEVPNEYATELSLEQRTVILKLHGQVDRTTERAWESFVVTEDHYIEYLAQAEVASVIPVGLAAKLRRSHFLFLGYSLSDWNLRLLLYRLWGDQPLGYRSWAVHQDPRPFELAFWRRHGVDVIDVPLEGYVDSLARHAGVDSETSEAPG
jgi:DNA-binding SARP family transcriptional activator